MLSFSFLELRRFVASSSVGVATFMLDMGLLYVLVEYGGVEYRIATAGAFLVCVTVNYMIARQYVFAETTSTYGVAYIKYIASALMFMGIITTGVWVLVTYVGLSYLVARVVVASVVGVCNYIVGVVFIFKVSVRA